MRPPHVPESVGVGWERLAPQLSRVPFYPCLLMFVFLANIAVVFTVAPQSTVRSIVIGVALTGVLSAAMGLVLRDRHRGAIVALGIIVIPISSLAPLLLAALGVAVVVAVVAYSSSRRRISWPSVTAAANLLSIGLLVMLMFKAISSGAATQMALDIGFRTEPAPPGAAAPTWYPDIYILLLDGYPRADTLARDLDHDPTSFIAGLRDRGFIVAPRSHSSYGYTAGTLASMFQMRHLDDIPELQDVLAGRAPRSPDHAERDRCWISIPRTQGARLRDHHGRVRVRGRHRPVL